MFRQDLEGADGAEGAAALGPSGAGPACRGMRATMLSFWAKSDLVAKHHSVIEGEAAPARRSGA